MNVNTPDLLFPHLGITIQTMKNDIMIGNFRIAYYGIIIGLGFFLAMLLVERIAKKTGQNADIYWDFFVYIIIFGVVGARIYYVLCEWDYYSAHPEKIINTREGGLAIYGGIIAVVLTLFVYCRIKKQRPLTMLDTLIPGLLLGQIMGRWGNFFNCEAFGGYTDSLFAMRIRTSLVNSSMINEDLISHLITENGVQYIQVHPTFLYESFWNFCTLLFLLWYGKRKKTEGSVFFLYMICYGIGRYLIEGIRTDSLYIPGTGIRISQAVALLSAAAGAILLVVKRKNTPDRLQKQ